MPWAASRGLPLTGDTCEQLQWPLAGAHRRDSAGGKRVVEWDDLRVPFHTETSPLCLGGKTCAGPRPFPHTPSPTPDTPTLPRPTQQLPDQLPGTAHSSRQECPQLLSGAYMRVKVMSVTSHQTQKMQNVQNSPQRLDRLPVSLWTPITAEQRRFSWILRRPLVSHAKPTGEKLTYDSLAIPNKK